jgi:hypothetical protein
MLDAAQDFPSVHVFRYQMGSAAGLVKVDVNWAATVCWTLAKILAVLKCVAIKWEVRLY